MADILSLSGGTGGTAPPEKVVAMPGIALPREQGKPIDRVVELCEELLAEARSGRLRGVGIAKIMAEPQLFTEVDFFSGPSPDRYLLVSAVRQLDTVMCQQMGWRE